MKTTIINCLESYVQKYKNDEKAIETGSLLESPAMIGYFEAKDILKQNKALNEIKGILEECKKLMSHEFDWEEQADNILEKIDKVLGEEIC